MAARGGGTSPRSGGLAGLAGGLAGFFAGGSPAAAAGPEAGGGRDGGGRESSGGGGLLGVSPPAGAGSAAAPEWSFLQCFGERAPDEEVQEADIISAVEFNQNGDYLASGDWGGRVVLFERVAIRDRPSSGAAQGGGAPPAKPQASVAAEFEYRYLTEFQSHEPEFDYLKSLEIEERINKVKWCQPVNGAHHLLSTNDKTIKLWKVYEKSVKCVTALNCPPLPGGGGGASGGLATHMRGPLGGAASGGKGGGAHRLSTEALDVVALKARERASALRLPRLEHTDMVFTARTRRSYANAHAYHINSISTCSDNETFISADDLRINLWNFEVSNVSFNIVDMKPPDMEDLTEVITSAEFHPFHCHQFVYSSSKGAVRLADMRDSALCDRKSKVFEETDVSGEKSFFSEIIASISDVKFSRDGRYLISRDYMSLKVWDVNMERAPVAVFSVHEGLRSKLCDLYENDCIFDKFECCASGNGELIGTGTYDNKYQVFSMRGAPTETLEASRRPVVRKALKRPSQSPKSGFFFGGSSPNSAGTAEEDTEASGSYSNKLLHLAWHPTKNITAVAAMNSLYLNYAQ